MVDSHCHLYFPEFDQDRDEVVKRARETGASFLVQVGASLEDSRKAVKLANQYDDMIASAGIHPHEAHKYAQVQSENLEIAIVELRRMALENKKVKAIGECGLDYWRIARSGWRVENIDFIKKMQIKLFEAQISLAQELSFPLVVHCRDAHADVVSILQRATSHPLPAVIIHCFTGNWEDAKRYLDIGCFISFSGIVTFQKKAEGIRESAIKTPLDRLLIETDAPYLAPTPFRGKRNEPAFIKNVIQSIADLRGASFDEIENATDQNARRVFKVFTPTPNKF